LLSRGSELLAEVAEPDFDRAEEFVVGTVHEGVGHALEQGQGIGQELIAQALPPLVAGFLGIRDGRSG
jgi:hypothetical protein